MELFDLYNEESNKKQQTVMSLSDYLELCKTDKMAYATAPERMLKAIGEPVVVDTSKDARLSRIFQNRTIRQYPSFSDFYGLEDTVERIVGYFRHAAQGLEEKRQVLYFLGPVGSSKSSLAERVKALMETYPIYVLTVNGVMSPVFESPLGLFASNPAFVDKMEKDFGIEKRYFKNLIPNP